MNVVLRRIAGFTANVLGRINRPVPIARTQKERKLLAGEVNRLRVYDYSTCPSSVKLRNALHRLNLDIQYCDIRKCQVHRDNLLAEFGRLHAPCLRIEDKYAVQWLADTDQIIAYLNQRFDPASQQQQTARAA